MHSLFYIFGALFLILVIIILHEMGHFFTARMFGVKILRFSIGFGKELYKKVGKSGTEYVIAAVPLGGYVKMLGDGGVNEALSEQDKKNAYNHKPLLVRMAIVLAGPCANFVLTILLFWAVYMIGIQHIKPVVGQVIPASFAAQAGLAPGDQIIKVQDKKTNNWQQVVLALFAHMGDSKKFKVSVLPKNSTQPVERDFNLSQWMLDKHQPEIFKSLGFYPFFPKVAPVIDDVMPKSPSAKVGLQFGDIIKSINNQPVKSWMQVVGEVRKMPGKSITLTVMRGTQTINYSLVVASKKSGDQTLGYLGLTVQPPSYPTSMILTERYNVLTAWFPAVMRTWEMFEYNVIVLSKMFTANLSFKTMGGPISIFKAAGQATQAGIVPYLSFMAFISLAIGFINLLPIPGLDGGHFLFQLIEGLIRRPIPARVQQVALTFGVMLVLFVVLYATFNDFIRLLS